MAMEAGMPIRIEGTEAHLEGDWTVSAVEENMDSLMLSLERIEAGGSKLLCIDCGQIGKADTCGLQLLTVWLLCARLRGVEPKLVNITANMRRSIRKSGLNSFTAL